MTAIILSAFATAAVTNKPVEVFLFAIVSLAAVVWAEQVTERGG